MRYKPRFSLRTLFALVTMIGVLFGAAMIWYHSQEAEYRRQLEVADRIIKHGGNVEYESRTPAWLKWIVDPKVFQRIYSVHTIRCRTNADVLAIIDELPALPTARQFDMRYSYLQDVDLISKLAKLDSLENIWFDFDAPVALLRSDPTRAMALKKGEWEPKIEQLKLRLPGKSLSYGLIDADASDGHESLQKR